MSPVISAKPVVKPTKRHRCEMCLRQIEGPHIRMYGHAYESDPPYEIRVCIPCSEKGADPKGPVRRALDELPASIRPAPTSTNSES